MTRQFTESEIGFHPFKQLESTLLGVVLLHMLQHIHFILSCVVLRHFEQAHLVAEGEELPQLIVVDGGKGQLSAAVEALEAMNLRGVIAVAGIAKRLEEIYFPGDSIPLYIDKNSETLRVVQHMRDEAHRFGITHHRNRRSKSQAVSALDAIPGVGEKTRQSLLTHFRSFKRVAEADIDEIAHVVGPAKASLVYSALHPEGE